MSFRFRWFARLHRVTQRRACARYGTTESGRFRRHRMLIKADEEGGGKKRHLILARCSSSSRSKFRRFREKGKKRKKILRFHALPRCVTRSNCTLQLTIISFSAPATREPSSPSPSRIAIVDASFVLSARYREWINRARERERIIIDGLASASERARGRISTHFSAFLSRKTPFHDVGNTRDDDNDDNGPAQGCDARARARESFTRIGLKLYGHYRPYPISGSISIAAILQAPTRISATDRLARSANPTSPTKTRSSRPAK